MHRLFVDQNVRIEVVEGLREDRPEAVHSTEVGLQQRDGETIFRWAREKGLFDNHL